ncbi:MAG: serine/threonine protein kinase [Planctomycetes bacterium]|nr:serine/threonine protein kinase [Planctomycetota bacterium]
MNPSERRLAETLIQTGRIRAGDLETCLREKKDGEGFLDALVRRNTLDVPELEAILADQSRSGAEGAPDPYLEAVRKLDRYIPLGLLGEGGMGRVYLAYDQKLKRSVALKVMKTLSAEDTARVKRELEIAAGLHHPNVAAVYDAHDSDAAFVIALQYVEGHSLDAVRLSIREALEAVLQAARAVQHAHDRGIIHRDLKPDNVMRTADGHVFVLDFGIARPVGKTATLTQTGVLVGTPAYMSPEQAAGEPLDARTDVYSLGATLYTLLTQRVPFEGITPLQILQKVVHDEPLRPRRAAPKIHRDIETIVLKAMTKDRALRYASADAFARDIERFLAGEPIEAKSLSKIRSAGRYLRRRPWAMATVIAVVLGLLASAGLLLQRHIEQRDAARADALVSQAARKIDEWDRLLYLPAGEDLTPYEEHLREALRSSDAALGISGGRHPHAYYQKARACARLGRDEEAERAVTEAIRLQADGAFFLERARLRLASLLARVLNDQTIEGLEDFLTKVQMPKPSFDPLRAAKGIAEDAAQATRLGQPGLFENACAECIEKAAHGDYDGAKKAAHDALVRCSPWQRAELHALLAWVHILTSCGKTEPLPPSVEAIEALLEDTALPEAGKELSLAIDIKRSGADLHLLRARLEVTRGVRATMGLIFVLVGKAADRFGAPTADPDMEKKVTATKEWARKQEANASQRFEQTRLEAYQSALKDIATARRLRPRDPYACLLRAAACALRFPISEVMDVGLLFGGRAFNTGRRTHMYDAVEVEVFNPAEAACQEALSLDPNCREARLALAQWRHQRVFVYASIGKVEPASTRRFQEEAIDAFAQALAFARDPEDEAQLREMKAMLHGMRLRAGGDGAEAHRIALREEIDRLKELAPQKAKNLESDFKKSLSKE